MKISLQCTLCSILNKNCLSTKLTAKFINYFYDVVRLNFSDAEIEVFVSEYDADGNELFDLDEIQAIEARIAIKNEPEER